MCPLRHPGLAKDAKSYQSDAPGHPKCIQKVTLGLYRVPRVTPKLSGVPPQWKNPQKDIKIDMGIPFCSKKCGSGFLKVGLRKRYF